jgi:hypothetical protein
MMNNDEVLNLDEIFQTIETAEVVRIRFLLLDKRLLIDNRHNEFDGPLVKLVNRSSSREESFKHLKRMRPRFPVPDKMIGIWWPKYVNTLYTTGVWGAIARRVGSTGFTESVRHATRYCGSCCDSSARRSATQSRVRASRRSGNGPPLSNARHVGAHVACPCSALFHGGSDL